MYIRGSDMMFHLDILNSETLNPLNLIYVIRDLSFVFIRGRSPPLNLLNLLNSEALNLLNHIREHSWYFIRIHSWLDHIYTDNMLSLFTDWILPALL